jgi:hypothetical protein
MKGLLLFSILVACIFAAGCHKSGVATAVPSESSSATNALDTQAETANGPVAPPEPPQPPSREVLARAENNARQAVVGEVDAVLTAELRAFFQQKNRLPATFAEFARARLDSVPRPPAGKKWVIDSENLEVKAVASQ